MAWEEGGVRAEMLCIEQFPHRSGCVQPSFGLACDWGFFAGFLILVWGCFPLVGFLDLRRLLGPPPALAGSGRMKLNSKVLPTVRVCGGTAIFDCASQNE